MFWSPIKIAPKKSVGIDIGTSSIKVVELGIAGERVKLENYGEVGASAFYEKPFKAFERNTLVLSNREIAQAIQIIFAKAEIQTREAIFSIPDFSSFFTTFKLPPMTEEELPEAVRFEARQHIPLPLSEVVLDWSLIDEGGFKRQKEGPEVLLVAVPHETINQYQEIAKMVQVKIIALEAEVFGLVRSLIKEKKGLVSIIDIGAQTSTINIIEAGILKSSHSFDVSANELTRVLSKSLNIDYNEAEGLKKRHGIKNLEINVGRAILPLLDLMLSEIVKVDRNFYQATGREIEKFIISGGTALMPGLREYFEKYLQKPTEIASPFKEIMYPPVLEESLKEMGPRYTVPVGMALRGLENLRSRR